MQLFTEKKTKYCSVFSIKRNNSAMVSDNTTLVSETFHMADSSVTGIMSSTVNSSFTAEDDYIDNLTSVSANCSRSLGVYDEGSVTAEQHEMAIFVMFQILMPIVCSIGFTGNLLSVGVLFHSHDKNAFSTYLKALTLSDMMILLLGIVQSVSKILQGYLNKEFSTLIDVWVHLIVNFGTFNFARGLSSLLITVLSIDRCVSVAFPLNIKEFVLEKYPKVTVAILLVVEVILRTPTVVWTYVKSYRDCTNTTVYYLEYRDWSKGPTLRQGFYWFLIICDMLLPVLIVIFMNMSILISLKRRPKLTASSKKNETKGAFEQNKILVTLMILSLSYILTVLPYTSVYILAAIQPNFTLASKEFYLRSVMIGTNILLVALNSANDFIIYILSSNRFRALFKKKYFCWVKDGLKGGEGSSIQRAIIKENSFNKGSERSEGSLTVDETSVKQSDTE